MSESINTVIIGAGVIGLACGRALATAGREVIVIERNAGIGQESSSRNSEVIHAGIYYRAGSLKARFCVAGKQALYAYCQSKGIAHRRIGKIIVATQPEHETRLRQLQESGTQNGVDDLRWLDAAAVHELEPDIVASAGLHSPSTGIIDTHALMLALQGDLEATGANVALQSRLTAAEETARGMQLTIESYGETTQLVAKNVINCAGLEASIVATLVHEPGADIPPTRYARGVYFEYAAQSPFSQLIYPLPEPGGLGVHATLDMSGALRFGPDVEWIDKPDYTVNPGRAAAFAESIQRWWPAVQKKKLRPGYAGVRPKLSDAASQPADFHISKTRRGDGLLVDLLGIESPGLTCALAIAEHVCVLLK